MSRFANISIFVPHFGCPNCCSFCNQHIITGERKMPASDDVKAAVEQAKSSRFGGANQTEIAFFGGSFTAIDRQEMTTLLSAAEPYVKSGEVAGIRVSTRPDAIDDEVLDILAHYGVTTIELGAQSMDDRVLTLNRRGHTAEDVENASRLIKSRGIALGLQMMTGLYGDTRDGAVETARRLAELSPDMVRIYPTIVLKNTYLAELAESGEFISDSLDDTVELCAKLLLFFEKRGIPVIRLGLHELKEEDIVSGPWHPAFSQLCRSRIYLNKLIPAFADKPAGEYTLLVGRGETSNAAGQKKSNKLSLSKLGYEIKIREKEGIAPYSFIIEGGTGLAAEINRSAGV